MTAQVLLVVAALIAVPIMLLPKPLVLQKRFQARQKQLEEYGRVSPHDEDEESGALRMAPPAHAHEEEFDFSEVIVHQVSLELESGFKDHLDHGGAILVVRNSDCQRGLQSGKNLRELQSGADARLG